MTEDSSRQTHPTDADQGEVVLDGIRYALLRNGNGDWRLGSISPTWREDVAAFPDPVPGDLATLAARGIWLAPSGESGQLAVMCCGLGSVWPGMGAGLYDNFPAARAAMDEVAALADWDVLGLMEETDLAKITQTRWQIPYLFLLEYAQWKQFLSLGLKPALVCGHSLGELVALCLAGVYSLKAIWHLLEIRSEHMTELEARAAHQSGMLAVPADYAVISSILEEFPTLRISNSNTPRQYILSGPREDLRKARKQLRHQKIPAMMLNIDLAFHNPAMRILRDLSERRLNGLGMLAPTIPLLSCVTCGLYPQSQPQICRYITDLDENTVDWTGSVTAMRDKFGIGCFLELGPQETLCGLVHEIDSSAACITSGGKNREVSAMREACARLFSQGYLSYRVIGQNSQRRPRINAERPAPKSEAEADAPGGNKLELSGISAADSEIILNLIASACHVDRASLALDMDLRHDLALRSSSFPFLVQEAEQKLKRPINLENLTQIATVGDLVMFLCGCTVSGTRAGDAEAHALSTRAREFLDKGAPLERFAPVRADNGTIKLQPLQIDPSSPWPASPRGKLVILCCLDATLLPELWSGLAPFGSRLAIPDHLLDKCRPLEYAGCALVPLACGANPSPAELLRAIEIIIQHEGSPSGILLAAAPQPACPMPEHMGYVRQLVNALAQICKNSVSISSAPWFCLFQRISTHGMDPTLALEAANAFSSLAQVSLSGLSRSTAICWLDERTPGELRNPHESGDMLALDLLYGHAPCIIWKRWHQTDENTYPAIYCPASPAVVEVFTDSRPPLAPAADLFQGLCQFSRYEHPSFSKHGREGLFSSADGAPWLPVGAMIESAFSAARLLAPWLQVIGFSDMRIFSFPALPAGITRECRISARAMPWLMLERVMNRVCRVNMEVREIAANGRRMANYARVCNLLCMLAATPAPMPALWDAHVSDNAAPWREDSLEDIFYGVLGFDMPWRMLLSRRQVPGAVLPGPEGPGGGGPDYEFLLSLPDIAKERDWEYRYLLHLVECVFHGALQTLCIQDCAPGDYTEASVATTLRKWRCGAIGFVRFDKKDTSGFTQRNLRLQLRCSWSDERLIRFDAQVCTHHNTVLLTLHHLEFDRIDGAD